jgi:hypothetical protein
MERETQEERDGETEGGRAKTHSHVLESNP